MRWYHLLLEGKSAGNEVGERIALKMGWERIALKINWERTALKMRWERIRIEEREEREVRSG